MTHKFAAVQTTIDGITFPSKLEGSTYSALKVIHDSGAIKDLCLQVSYPLHSIAGSKVCVYQLDFLVKKLDGGEVAFESKGVMTPVASLKLKLFTAEYKIPLYVVTAANLLRLEAIARNCRDAHRSLKDSIFTTELAHHLTPFGKRATSAKKKAKR